MTDELRFYMTYARSRPKTLVPWIEEHNVPILDNAIHRWSDANEELLPPFEYDTSHVIDAGGYNVMASFVTRGGNLSSGVEKDDVASEHEQPEPFYPWSIEDYHQWCSEHSEEFEWATVMDYACEDRFNSLWSVDERIEATFENTLAQFNKNPDYKLLPVLQGRSADAYIDFYERLEDHGIPTDHVGLGTVCRISSEKKIVELETEIRDRIGDVRMHGFGVKIQAFKHGGSFESADSQAWVYGPSNGKCSIDDGNRIRTFDMKDDSRARTIESFKNYYSYVTRLQQGESAVEYTSPAADVEFDAIAEQVVVDAYAQ